MTKWFYACDKLVLLQCYYVPTIEPASSSTASCTASSSTGAVALKMRPVLTFVASGRIQVLEDRENQKQAVSTYIELPIIKQTVGKFAKHCRLY